MHRIRRLKAKKPEDHEELDQTELDFLELCRAFGDSDDENQSRPIGTVSPSPSDAIPQCTSSSFTSLDDDGERDDPPSIPLTQYVNERARKACEQYYKRFFFSLS